MQTLSAAFWGLAPYRQWIVWQAVPKANQPGKVDKLPVDPRTGRVASAQNPEVWTDPQTAIEAAQRFGQSYGVGFVFTANDPFFFLDVDHCGDGTAEGWTDTARYLCGQFPGAAVEVSQSGQGLHIIGRAARVEHGCDCKLLGSQLYTSGRFVALTGFSARGSADADCTEAFRRLVAEYFPPTAVASGGAEWTTEPRPEWSGPADDVELIALARRSNSAGAIFGAGVSFSDLFDANADALGRKWPDDHQGRAYDESGADAALAQRLAFWTGCDCERIDRIMRRSALARAKWDDRPDYLTRTITGACARQTEVYTGSKRERASDAPAPGEPRAEPQRPGGGAHRPELVAGYPYLPPAQQVEYFQGCYYIREKHKILVPDGELLGPQQFRAAYGGYVFGLDASNSKTSRSAWEVFTESQAVRFPKVADTIFMPDREPGQIIEHEGRRLVNSYVPVPVPCEPGDVTPFLDHAKRLVPMERDREIFLAYLAALVQHQGDKFQWTPLIQGAPGNGKTLFSTVVAEAIGRRHWHVVKPEEVGSRFNGWMVGKTLGTLEDVRLKERHDLIESLKPMITNRYLPIEPKGVDVVTAYVVVNFILNSNHRDAIQKTRDDRRFAVFFTPQQTEADVIRDGMGGDYFPRLYQWLREGGFAHTTYYLRNYEIPPELNPAVGHGGLCHRAPVTSSTEDAIAVGLGSVEQEVLEAVEEGRPGFAGGWVSSMALDRLLSGMRASRQIPQARRREMMQSIGYDWHPALPNGRVNNPVQPDGGKPRLYIRRGHIHANLRTPTEVARAHTEAQTHSLTGPSAVELFGKQ